jgi:hypothetical protein
MRPSGDEDTFSIVDRAFCAIDEKVNKCGVEALTPEERVVHTIWGVLGILENGSFGYFFENGLRMGAAIEAFERLGLSKTAEYFRLAESLLPENCSYDQLKQQADQHEAALDTLAMQIVRDGADAQRRLFQLIVSTEALKPFAK